MDLGYFVGFSCEPDGQVSWVTISELSAEPGIHPVGGLAESMEDARSPQSRASTSRAPKATSALVRRRREVASLRDREELRAHVRLIVLRKIARSVRSHNAQPREFDRCRSTDEERQRWRAEPCPSDGMVGIFAPFPDRRM